MDWELKATSWGFEELERESEHNISSQIGPSNGSDEQKGNCFVGLKLGRFGDLGQVSLNMWEDSRVSTMVSTSPLVTTKRARVCVNGAHIVSCLVDGCKADLSKCRDYHRRHKVCEIHSKTPKVIVGGQEQRFCQQCSRFHKLVEFDEVKRSCRKRLDGHNRRRRKLQPKSLSLNSGSLYSNPQGTRVLPFENPLLFSSTSKMSPTWAGVIKTEEDTMVNSDQLSSHYTEKKNPFPWPISLSYKEINQIPFLQVNDDGSNRMNLEVSLSKPLINNDTLSKNDGTDRKMLFSDELPRVLDSDSALSLLSSSLTQFSRLSLSHKDLQPDSNLISQPLVAELQYNNVAGRYQSQSADGETMNSVLFPGETDAKLYCQGIFHLEPYESSQNEMPQTFPFSWE